jgi:ABC-2 type transport system ATP-binding protein
MPASVPSPPGAGPILRAEAVRVRYGATAALDDIDLTISPGITGLLGPNGAGKTTLLRVIATAQRPDAGTIRVGAHEATGGLGERTAVRRMVGYMPQEVGFPRGMTAFSFLDYIAVLKEWDDQARRHAEVRRVLEAVQLGDRAGAKVRTLSGGQRRRLALAQALIGDPALLILDEPTTGLDPEQRAVLRALLSGRAGDRTVLLATHQTEDVAALCERVIVMVGGRVRFDGAVRDFVAGADGLVWLADAELPGARASWRTGTGRIRSVGGDPGAGAVPAEPTVEDAYLLLLGRSADREMEAVA